MTYFLFFLDWGIVDRIAVVEFLESSLNGDEKRYHQWQITMPWPKPIKRDLKGTVGLFF
jgi:hypothetical protein